MLYEGITGSWREISPELGYITETMNVYMYLFVIIILIALGFGIVNTMLMVVLERIHEIGMLMAVGMKRIQIFKMIMLRITSYNVCYTKLLRLKLMIFYVEVFKKILVKLT